MTGDPEIRRWHKLLNGTAEQRRTFSQEFFRRDIRQVAFQKLEQAATPDLAFSIWRDALGVAEKYNVPGRFTSLLGFEWTSAPGGSNLHRVVVFRDNAELVGRVLPLSSRGNAVVDELWDYLEQYEKDSGGRALAIPHNGNLSNGLMFPVAERYGEDQVDSDYAARRIRWEPVVEVTQIKGDGEAHPLLSPDDDFADYETWDAGNFEGAPKTDAMLPFEYARPALKNGLALQRRLGVNPYAFGMMHTPPWRRSRRTTFSASTAAWNPGLSAGSTWWDRPASGRSRAGSRPPQATRQCGQGKIPARPCGTLSSGGKFTPQRGRA